MAAGIPIIVKKGLSCEKYVKDNEIGAAATDFEDVYRIAVSESEDKLSQYYAKCQKTAKFVHKWNIYQKIIAGYLDFV